MLFDLIERALKDTVYESLIDDLYRFSLINMIICQKCGVSRKREEKFLDLVIQTKGLQGVAHSLNQMFEFDKLDGDNKLFCESCNEKTDTLKGYRIQKLPPILTIDLNRFDFDYNTF
jgi:ubiquitin C-terminal hydrolase